MTVSLFGVSSCTAYDRRCAVKIASQTPILKQTLQAVGGQDGGHLQDAGVIVVVLELGAGLLVDDKGYIRVKLQRGGGDGGGDGAFDGLGDGGGFRGAAGQQQDAVGFQDGADAHGNGALGEFFAGSEKLAIVVDGFLAENFQAGAGAEAGSGLVETDVAVAADAEDLQVDAAGVTDGMFVGAAVAVVVGDN